MKKINVITLGCSKNTVDSEHLMARLAAAGYEVLFDSDRTDAKVVVINTCGFIGDAKQESVDMILRTTLLVGYPGETEADFAELEQFVRDVRFERLGVFAYSEEEGTYSAQELKDDVPEEVKQQRVERIMTLQNDIARENNLRRVGRTERVLIESRQGDYYVGRTQYDSPEVDQEILIPAAERRLLRGHFYEIRIDGAADYDLYGKAVRK